MAYGIHVENPSGSVQIDQDYVNYFLVATTSFNVTYDSNFRNSVEADLAITGYTPATGDLCAVNTGHIYNQCYIRPSGSGIRYTVWPTGATATVNVRIYRRADLLAAGTGYGINVYKSNGTSVAFSSAYSPMRVYAVITGQPPFTNTTTVSGFTPYITSNTGFTLASIDPPEPQYAGESEYQTVGASSTQARADYSVETGANGDDTFFYDGTVQMLVLK